MQSRRSGAPSNRHVELRAWLEHEILEGNLRPGERLDEQKICEQFNVSRTPVREALLQLASIDLVVFRPRQGAAVARMSVKKIAAMWEVLTSLEGSCAASAARRMTDADRAQLKRVHEAARALVSTSDVNAYDATNRDFHETIYAGCRNEYLASLVRDIRRRLRIYRRYPFQQAGGIEQSFLGHDRVVEAIVARNEGAAELAMRQHIAAGLSFLDLVAELPDDRDVPLSVVDAS
jgi:DNA-binding GntR family transcriptional regulator